MIPIPEGFPSIRRKPQPQRLNNLSIKQSAGLQTGNVVVISIPPGGEIYIDTVSTGTYASALITGISTGSHDIKVTLLGYVDFTYTTTIDDGTTRTIFAIMTPTSPPTGTGTLSVTSIPSGAEFGIYSGGTGSYTAPTNIPDIPAGINAYEGGLTNYAPVLGSFVINSGEITNLNLHLFSSNPNMGLVIIESTPMGAEIFIDGTNIGAHTSFMTMMNPGSHTYELRLPGYVPVTGAFNVVTGTDNPKIISAQLQMYGKIIVFSVPPGARIWDDGHDTRIDSSAIIYDIIPGIHEIILKKSGYADYISSSINIDPGSTEAVFAILEPSVPPTDTGSLNVTSTPSGAEFFIFSQTDDIANELAPTSAPIDILAGTYGYRAIFAGSSMVIGSVTIRSGETTDLNIVLPPDIADSGLVIFETIPMGADIYIDGIPTGAKTSYATFIAQGPHTYELRLEGYPTVTGDFVVVTGTDNPAIVSVVLQSESSGLIMLAGVAVLGMMVMSKKPPLSRGLVGTGKAPIE